MTWADRLHRLHRLHRRLLQVTKVLFSPNTTLPRIAVGVQFKTNTSAPYIAYARREVIVSAGAIGVISFSFVRSFPASLMGMLFLYTVARRPAALGDWRSCAACSA